MLSKIGNKLDDIELSKIERKPIIDLLLEAKDILLLALQLVNLLAIFFSQERKAKLKLLITRLKASS